MAFTDVVRVLDETRVVAIVTRRSDGSPAATPIWSMVVDGVPYLRSAYGAASWWYRHVQAGREVAFAIGDGAVAEKDRDAALALPRESIATEHVAADDPVQAAIDRELHAKYGDEPAAVAEMLTDHAMQCTLRVVAPVS